MSTHTFTLTLAGDVDAHLDELYEAGCDDATFSQVDGVPYADFDREADTFELALVSAIDDVRRVHAIEVTGVEPGDLVTASDIAHRLGRSRESVRLLAAGKRGSANPFPAPVAFVTDRNRLWRWTDVLAWNGDFDRGDAELVGALNAALELRHRLTRTPDAGRSLISSILPVDVGTDVPRPVDDDTHEYEIGA